MPKRTTPGTTSTTGRWAGWIAAITGAWVVVTPFVAGGGDRSTLSALRWSNVVTGLLIVVLASYAGRQASGSDYSRSGRFS